MAGDDPSPGGSGPQDEESHTAFRILRARFLSRDCGIGMTVYLGLLQRLPWRQGRISSDYIQIRLYEVILKE